MEDVPPSYEEATAWNHWKLVAPYIQSSDLCSASRVCTAWYAIFEPCLWGNPASHFGTENDRVYGAHVIYSTPHMPKSCVLIDPSCSDQIQANLEKSPAERQKAHPYAAPSTGPIRDLRWTAPSLAPRYLGATTESTVPLCLAVTLL